MKNSTTTPTNSQGLKVKGTMRKKRIVAVGSLLLGVVFLLLWFSFGISTVSRGVPSGSGPDLDSAKSSGRTNAALITTQMRPATSIHTNITKQNLAVSPKPPVNRNTRSPSPLAQSLSDSALRQIAALQDEKARRTPVQQKIDSQLLYSEKMRRGLPIANGVPTLRVELDKDEQGRLEVDISAIVTDGLLERIADVGGKVINSFAQYQAIRAWMPLAQIEPLAAWEDVKCIRPAARALMNVGSVVSEGYFTHNVNVARNSSGATGAGVKVGVLSDSVDYLDNSQALGDLGAVTVITNQSGILQDGKPGTGEGTAMLEIVHDLAPNAQLFFATAHPSPQAFAQNILDLRFKYGCDIIVDDAEYVTQSPFQDDTVAQAVNQVTADGALYFSSAGNSGNRNEGESGTWEGDFNNGGNFIHSFGSFQYNTVTATHDIGNYALLFWSDPLQNSTNDYDLYLLDWTGTTIVNASNNHNTIHGPLEGFGNLQAGESLVVLLHSGSARFLHLETGRGRLAIGTSGRTKGQASAVDAFCVAAVNVATASYTDSFVAGSRNPVEPFSSDGPRRVFYYADGTPITPGNFSSTGGAVRQKPDIAAADGVTTSVPGFAPFNGTSAAAPHAAAIAALLKSYNPALTPAQIRSALTGSALDIMATGLDRDSGYGIVIADGALLAVSGPAQPIITSFSPSSGAPGGSVVISGANFTGATSVKFNGANAAFMVYSSSQIAAIVPAGATTGPISVASPGGFASSVTTFTVLNSPANDNFASAFPLPGSFNIFTFNNLEATKETGEPNHAGVPGGRSLWFYWVAPSNGVWTFDTSGSSFDTSLAIYTGNSATNLSLVASANDSQGFTFSSVTFTATSNMVYRIAVDGYNGAGGDFILRYQPTLLPLTIYKANFGTAQGYSTSVPLAGQQGWIRSGTGGNGIVKGFFPDSQQQAYIGYSSGNNLQLERPFNYTPDLKTRPIVQFSVKMRIYNSTNFRQDHFQWRFFNQSSQRLFSLDFNNADYAIGYVLDGAAATNQLSDAAFDNNTIFTLTVTMDFANNLWTAYLDDQVVAFNRPITTANAALNLRSVTVAWVQDDVNNPGDNFMVFDDYTITAEAPLAPSIIGISASTTVTVDTHTTLAVLAGGSTPFSYQWNLNGISIPGATNAIYAIPRVSAADAGAYSVVVNNTSGSTTSGPIVLSVNARPASLPTP